MRRTEMRRHSGKTLRITAACAFAALVLLCVSGAAADLLLFATAEDCAGAPLSSWEADDPHAVILQKAGKDAQKAAREALEKAGVKDAEFLDLPAVKEKNRTAENLKKKWETADNTARIASLLRQRKDGRIIYYAAGGEDVLFLSGFADRCAAAASDPACRRKKKQPDEYVHEVRTVTDGASGAERAALPAEASWKDAWEASRRKGSLCWRTTGRGCGPIFPRRCAS